MKWLRLVLVVWASCLLALFALKFVLSPTEGSLIACLLLALCLGLALLTYRDVRAAWIACLMLTVLALIRFLPAVAHNVFLFMVSDPLYVNSPGTIVIVGVIAVFFCLPSVLVSILAIIHRRELMRVLVLRGQQDGA